MKKKHLLLSIIALVFIAVLSQAQTKREILAEDPKLSPNLRLEISPLDFKTASPYNFGGASIRLGYRVKNKFSLVGEFRTEYFDMEDDLDNIKNGYTIGNPVTKTGMGAEVTGTFYFASKEKEADEWMPIKKRQISHNTIEVTVDPVATTKLNLYGLRGGYALDKSTNTIYGVTISEIGQPANSKTDQTVIPLETRTFAFGGLSYTRIKNVKVRYPTYGVRRKQVCREIYADVLMGGNPKADNVVYYDEDQVMTTYQIDSYGDANKIGWRVGIFSTPTGRLINVGYGVEIATMPGGDVLGINAKLVFSLFKKAGLKGE
jgi:hypothetical protein